MPRYRYKTADAAGATSEGEMEAVSREAAVERLRASDRLPIRVDEIGALGSHFPQPNRWLAALNRPLFGGDALRTTDVIAFTRELATLLAADIAVDRALGLVGSIAAAPRVGRLATRLEARVRSGSALSTALEAEGAVFDRFYRAMVRAGEASGGLAPVLERIHSELARIETLKDSLRSALIYPVTLLVVALLSVVALLVFVMPQFEVLFRESGRDLPWLTQAVIAAASFLRNWGWLLLLVVIGGIVAGRAMLAEPKSRLRADRWLLGLPVLGELLRRLEVERFAGALAMLLGGGVALPTAVAIAADAVKNRALSGALGRAEIRLREGSSLVAALAEAELPAKARELVRIGEETGRLEAMLVRLAEIYDREVATAIRRLIAVAEPALILGLGVIVAAIILSVLSAIVGIYDLAV